MVNSQEHLLIITMKGLILHGNGLNKKESNTKLFSTNLFKILVLYMCQNVGLCNLPICKVLVCGGIRKIGILRILFSLLWKIKFEFFGLNFVIIL